MKIAAIIPARGGSKRIPNKNIRLFHGRPIISYSIAVAREVGLFDKIIVSTDSVEISDIARSFGAEVPFVRPAHLSGDAIGTDEVIKHALESLAVQGDNVDYACCIYATAPMLKPNYIREGFERLKAAEAITAFSVSQYPYSIYRSLKMRKDGRIEMLYPEHYCKRTQEFPETYHDAAQFYWMDVKKYLREGRIYSQDSVPIFIPRWLVQDIDTLQDWEMAEKMFSNLYE